MLLTHVAFDSSAAAVVSVVVVVANSAIFVATPPESTEGVAIIEIDHHDQKEHNASPET